MWETVHGNFAAPAEKLAKAFEVMADGLRHPGSEADYSYTAFAARLPKRTKLTAERFRAAAGLASHFTVNLVSDEVMSTFESWAPPPEDEPLERVFHRYRRATVELLKSMMVATVTDLVEAYVSDGERSPTWDHYVIGRLADGSLVGLRTTVVQT
jgi:hypothetical protein